MAVVSILATLCSLNVFPHRVLTQFIESIPGNWIYAVGGVIIFLVSLRLLVAGIGFTGSNSLKLTESKTGDIHLGKSALEDYIARLAEEIYGIYNVKAMVKLDEDVITVRVNASIETGINIPETSAEVKENVRESVKKVTGIEVKEIEMFFKQIKAKEVRE